VSGGAGAPLGMRPAKAAWPPTRWCRILGKRDRGGGVSGGAGAPLGMRPKEGAPDSDSRSVEREGARAADTTLVGFVNADQRLRAWPPTRWCRILGKRDRGGGMTCRPGERTSGLWTAALTGCMLLTGCETMQSTEVAEREPDVVVSSTQRPTKPARQVSDAENLLSYFAQLRKLSGSELVREHDSARQAFSSGRSEFNRVRLAMVVTLPNTPFYDEYRALDLLEPLARNSDSQLSGLAALLLSQIQERKRLDANTQALQQKLDALKSLERSLIERKR
jgi:hypothetical protein